MIEYKFLSKILKTSPAHTEGMRPLGHFDHFLKKMLLDLRSNYLWQLYNPRASYPIVTNCGISLPVSGCMFGGQYAPFSSPSVSNPESIRQMQ
jgi:hypothetical protein